MNIYPWQGGGGEKGYRTTVCIPNTGPKILRELLYFLNENLILFLFTLLSDLSLPTIERFLHFPRFSRWPVPSLTPMWRSANGAKSAVFSFFFFLFFAIATPSTRACPRGEKIGSRRFQEFPFFFFFFLSIPLKSTYLKISYEQLTITLSNRSIDRSIGMSRRASLSKLSDLRYLWIFSNYLSYKIFICIRIRGTSYRNEMKWEQERRRKGKEKKKWNF